MPHEDVLRPPLRGARRERLYVESIDNNLPLCIDASTVSAAQALRAAGFERVFPDFSPPQQNLQSLYRPKRTRR
jgi:hypothetical protein